MEPQPPRFTPAALEILDRLPFDPGAVASYDLMPGGLLWPDEFPQPLDPARDEVLKGYTYRFLLGYRASLTVGVPRPELQFAW